MRTDDHFKGKADLLHYKDQNITAIEKTGIGCVSHYMDAVCESVGKQLSMLWIKCRKKSYSKLILKSCLNY